MDKPYGRGQRMGHIVLTFLTLIAFVLCVLSLTAGSTPLLTQARIMTIDMTGKGTPIWAKRDLVDEKDPGVIHSRPAATNTVSALPNKVNQLHPTQTNSQLLPDFYYVYLWAWCGGVYETKWDQATTEIKACSAWTPAIDYNVGLTIASLVPPETDIDPGLESDSLAGALYIAYAVATSLTGVAFALEAFTIFKKWKYMHEVFLFIYSIAFFASIVGSSGATWLIGTLVHKINEAGIHDKTSANIGGNWLAFTWTTVVFLLLRLLFLVVSQMGMFKKKDEVANKDKGVPSAPVGPPIGPPGGLPSGPLPPAPGLRPLP